MNNPKFPIVSLLCAAAVFIFGATICETTFGQAEGVRSMQLVDKPISTMNSRTTALLRQPHIRHDLELTQDQVDRLTQIQTQHDKIITDVMGEYQRRSRQMQPAERSAFKRDLAAKRKQSQEEMETEIREILLPFQMTRMEQIKVQNQIERLGQNAGSPVLHPIFRDKLKFTKEQQERIKSKMQEVKSKLEKDIAELRRKANDEILEELTDEQRKIYDETIGEPLKKPNEIDR